MARHREPIAATCARRRQRLLDRLGDGVLVLPTAPQALRNGDVHYDFRPGSDFDYLTGFPEPDAVLVAWRTGRGRHRAVLFVAARDREREVWEGRRHGVAGARRRFGATEAHPIGELWQRLPELLRGHARVFYSLGRDRRFDERLLDACRRLAIADRRQRTPANPVFEDPVPALAELRLVKEPGEIALLETAAQISAAGHLAAMRAARPGLAEYQVQAELERELRRRGSPRNGYPSIVASGANACILHYTANDRTLRRGDLLLIDAGAEYGGYTADITRTFPVGAAFSPAQRAVYRVVLAAQKAGIRAVRPGARCDAPHLTCQRYLTRGLVELGVLRGDPRRLFAKRAFAPWYMHGTSHWLGRDVHDVGAYRQDGKPVALRAGMVLTVEPGLYFQPRDRSVPAELRGIGVRIEDDVLVTGDGCRVLTASAPKEIHELEAVTGAAGRSALADRGIGSAAGG